MAKLTFKTDNCKGCGLCIDACPKNVLVLAKDKINKNTSANDVIFLIVSPLCPRGLMPLRHYF